MSLKKDYFIKINKHLITADVQLWTERCYLWEQFTPETKEDIFH